MILFLTLFASGAFILTFLPPDQRLDLCKLNPSDSDAVRGQIVGEDGHTDKLSLFPLAVFFFLLYLCLRANVQLQEC